MIPILIALAVIITVLLGLVSFVQLLYLESMRLRARELPALEYFKETLEDRIGLKTERGALAFSLLKHALLVTLGLVVMLVVGHGGDFSAGPVVEAFVFALVAMLLGAYMGPQLLYRRTEARWLTSLAPALKLMALPVRPLTGIFSFVETVLSLGENKNGEDENGSSTEEDLEALIEAGADEGLIEEDDRELIHSVVTLGDKTVREVMTARPNVVAIPQDTTIEDFRQLALESHFSRFPVYRETIDDIVGIVHVRDILKLDYDERTKRTVKEFIHQSLFVPETKPVDDLFRELQRDNTHMAIVVDEYGETAGIATMEDVVEEVFGEIADEYDPATDEKEESEGVYLLSGSVDLDRLHELVDFRPDEGTESTTVGGLVCEWLGRVPEVNEAVERDGIRIEVTGADGMRVEQVRVSRSDHSEEDGEPNGK